MLSETVRFQYFDVSFKLLTLAFWHLTLSFCFRLRNDLYCVEWGVKLYSLTLSFCLDVMPHRFFKGHTFAHTDMSQS